MANILLAEDDLDFQSMLRQALQGAGHLVTTASTGLEAFGICISRDFDLVITDISMHDGDGLEVTQAIRKRCPGTRLIAISGGGLFPASQYLAVAEKLGASRTLAKPFSIADLLTHVNLVLAESFERTYEMQPGPTPCT